MMTRIGQRNFSGFQSQKRRHDFMEEEFSKEKKKQLAKNREKLIRTRVPVHSKVPTKEYYKNYDRTFRKK
jgi:hypothetical protein